MPVRQSPKASSKPKAKARAKGADAARPAAWLVKQEPSAYPFARLAKDGRTTWDGVRNFEARNNLQAMKAGDIVLYYHSGGEKAVVGLAKVVRAAYPDPTTREPQWVAVDIAPVGPLASPVPLSSFRADPALAGSALLRTSRLSVVPITAPELARVLELGDR